MELERQESTQKVDGPVHTPSCRRFTLTHQLLTAAGSGFGAPAALEMLAFY